MEPQPSAFSQSLSPTGGKLNCPQRCTQLDCAQRKNAANPSSDTLKKMTHPQKYPKRYIYVQHLIYFEMGIINFDKELITIQNCNRLESVWLVTER